MKVLRLILGDQLNSQHSWFDTPSSAQKQVVYTLMEVREEASYVTHHIQKVVGFFLSMRTFANELRERGYHVDYLTLDDPRNQHRIDKNLLMLAAEHQTTELHYQEPDEVRLDEQLKALAQTFSGEVSACSSEHFYTERHEFAALFKGKKTYLMETFYRHMRRVHRVLMNDEEPEGGAWNFDHENRSRYKGSPPPPAALPFRHEVRELTQLLETQKIATIGRINPDAFPWPKSRAEALQVLARFLDECLPHFGTYQDAMHASEPFLFHSLLSFALNTKMISPREVVAQAEKAWRERPAEITLAQVEGFIRQILGWREYMRGIYWAEMPSFKSRNFFGHTEALPEYFWTGETQMACVKSAVTQSLDHAYAHHIQRLMVTGNFMLLAGISPEAADAWYLGIYIDAIEWVEITNTRGMSQFADGGIVGTKPYVSSANYIKKMSNYCGACTYDPGKRHGPGSCPFNSLYWEFFERHRALLDRNPRIGMVYRTLGGMTEAEKKATFAQAKAYRAGLAKL